MTDETKSEAAEPENLFKICDSSLSVALKQCCLDGLTDMENINKFNALLDASIKFNQLTISINHEEEKRRQFMAEQVKREMMTAKAE